VAGGAVERYREKLFRVADEYVTGKQDGISRCGDLGNPTGSERVNITFLFGKNCLQF
jgi:hypothetical protein